MLTRRNFIESAAVISGTALSGVTFADDVGVPPARLDRLIYNVRFAHAQLFAQHLIAQGVHGVGIGDSALDKEGDLGALWFGQLRAHCVHNTQCQTRPSIVGMGSHTDFFVMQSLAHNIGLATRFHAEHRREHGTWRHEIKQNDWTENDFKLAIKEDWTQALAHALSSSCGLTQSPSVEKTHLMNSHEPRLLVSWVLG